MRRLFLYASFVVFFLSETSRLHAQQTYTLDECIELALQNNVRIKNADNDLRAAEQQRKSAFTNYFPAISATGFGFLADKGVLEMNMEGQRVSMMKNGLIGGVTASLPVFTGGQIVYGNKLAKVNEEVSRLKHRQSENEVRLTVEQYFWQVVMLKEKLRALSTVQEQLKEIHKDVDAAVAAGVTDRNDLLQVQLRKNEIQSSYISVENALNVSRNLLGQYIGHMADSIDVAVTMDGSLPNRPDELYQSPEASLASTSEYHLLGKQVDVSHLKYKMTVGKNLPTVAIGGGYMYDNLMDHSHPFWIGSVTVSVPLTKWWSGSHDIKQQRLKVRNSENQMADQRQLLIIKMQNTWNAVTDAYKQVEIAIESIGQASENLRLQKDYYQAGTCTMSDLLEAQSLYQQSRDRYVESHATYEVKKREYLQATGRQ